jgi:hypothetical protein
MRERNASGKTDFCHCVGARPPGGAWKVQLVIGVFQAKAAGVLWVWGAEFRVKARVSALRVVVKLAINAQPRLRPDVLQKKALAPARVGNDDVGHKALFLQRQGASVGRLAPHHLGLKVC